MLILVILAIGILFFLSSKQNPGAGSLQQSGNQTGGLWQKITRTLSGITGQGNQGKIGQKDSRISTSGSNTAAIEGNAAKATQPGAEDIGTKGNTVTASKTGLPESSLPQNGNALQTVLSRTPETCQQAASQVSAFYAHLDAQPYIQAFQLKKKSSVYFSELMQKLLDNPPVITRETDDLFTVLKNTSHFYRVIGKNNIIILKTILDKERPYIENTLADFFALTESPDCLEKNFLLHIPPYTVYDYAGFFLNTMGGRLYLFRRDSGSRMTVTYYSILVIDKANKESKNKDGIQIRKAIDSLITEMENSGTQLRLKEKYLDKLYELKEKYQ